MNLIKLFSPGGLLSNFSKRISAIILLHFIFLFITVIRLPPLPSDTSLNQIINWNSIEMCLLELSRPAWIHIVWTCEPVSQWRKKQTIEQLTSQTHTGDILQLLINVAQALPYNHTIVPKLGMQDNIGNNTLSAHNGKFVLLPLPRGEVMFFKITPTVINGF